MMYNTTTEPTIENHITMWQLFLNCIGISSLTFVMVQMIYKWNELICDAEDAEDAKDAEDTEDAEDAKDAKDAEYNKKYEDELKALKERNLDEVDFLTLSKQWVNEETPGGNVVMNYDRETDCFVYYTDHLKQITYGILETVARKFVVENDCKIIYIQAKLPVEVSSEGEVEGEGNVEVEGEVEGNVEAECDIDCEGECEGNVEVECDIDCEGNVDCEGEVEDKSIVKQLDEDKKPSVFAKFKKYNTGGKGSVPNFKSNVNVIEQSNHFRYKGKLYDYNTYKETLKHNDVCNGVKSELDYATFKRQILEKNK